MKYKHLPWLVFLISALHIIWAGIILVAPVALNATPLFPFSTWSSHWASTIIFVSAVLAIGGYTRSRGMTSILLQIPQLILVYLSAIAAVQASALGYYADGTIIPRAHIFADQLPNILRAVFYSCAVVSAREEDNGSGPI